MQSLYEDPWFTFRFADDRLVGRIHLEGVAAGRAVRLWWIDPATGQRRDPFAEVVTSAEGWVDLPAPVVVRAGEAFIAAVEGARDADDRRPAR